LKPQCAEETQLEGTQASCLTHGAVAIIQAPQGLPRPQDLEEEQYLEEEDLIMTLEHFL
jgi:hypothetical protein